MKGSELRNPPFEYIPVGNRYFSTVRRFRQGCTTKGGFRNSEMKRGFTLIELLLGISLFSVMVLLISQLFSLTLFAHAKNKTISDVDAYGTEILHLMTQTLRNAKTVTVPTLGTSSPSLSFAVDTPSRSPTLFDLVSNTLRITLGSGQPVALHPARIQVTNLLFSNLARPATPAIIHIEFTVSANTSSPLNAYDYQKTFYGSAALRQ